MNTLLARQLHITAIDGLRTYQGGEQRWDSVQEICAQYGYVEITEPLVGWRLTRWLYALCWTGTDLPSVLFEMLHACHDRVERSLSLLARLVAHVQAHGHDEDSRSAAHDVLRYFDLATPHHHQDEELHVLPPLLASDDAAQRALAEQLVAEHRRMEVLWAMLRGPLQQWAEAPPASTAFPQPEALAEFTSVYAEHIAREEGRAYPLARTLLDTVTLSQMGAEMSARRRTHATGTPW